MGETKRFYAGAKLKNFFQQSTETELKNFNFAECKQSRVKEEPAHGTVENLRGSDFSQEPNREKEEEE